MICSFDINGFNHIYKLVCYDIAKFADELREDDIAEKYYLESAENGKISAICRLGLLHERNKNYEKMKICLNKAVENGNIHAALKLGSYYRTVEKNDELSEKYYLFGAKNGCYYSMHNLANLYYHKKKNIEDIKIYCNLIIKNKKCSDKLISSAMLGLGDLYQFMEKNKVLMEKYYKMASKKGNIVAINRLAALYHTQKKYKLEKKYCMIGVKKKDTISMAYLGLYFFDAENNFDNLLKYFAMSIKHNCHDKEGLINILYGMINEKMSEIKDDNIYKINIIKYKIKSFEIEIKDYL
jgi:TPR repeat protein